MVVRLTPADKKGELPNRKVMGNFHKEPGRGWRRALPVARPDHDSQGWNVNIDGQPPICRERPWRLRVCVASVYDSSRIQFDNPERNVDTQQGRIGKAKGGG